MSRSMLADGFAQNTAWSKLVEQAICFVDVRSAFDRGPCL